MLISMMCAPRSTLMRAAAASIVERRIGGDLDRRLAWLLILATIPAAAIGFVGEDLINRVLHADNDSVRLAIAALVCAISSLGLLVLSPGHERRGGEVARDVEGRGEGVGDGIHGDEDADSFGRETDGQEERRQHDEGAPRNAGDCKGEEHGGERDGRQIAAMQRNAVEPADKERADRPRQRRGDLERRDCQRKDEAGDPRGEQEPSLGALDERG